MFHASECLTFPYFSKKAALFWNGTFVSSVPYAKRLRFRGTFLSGNPLVAANNAVDLVVSGPLCQISAVRVNIADLHCSMISTL